VYNRIQLWRIRSFENVFVAHHIIIIVFYFQWIMVSRKCLIRILKNFFGIEFVYTLVSVSCNSWYCFCYAQKLWGEWGFGNKFLIWHQIHPDSPSLIFDADTRKDNRIKMNKILVQPKNLLLTFSYRKMHASYIAASLNNGKKIYVCIVFLVYFYQKSNFISNMKGTQTHAYVDFS